MATVTTDKLAMYRKQIEDVIREYGSYKPSYGDVEREIIIDRAQDHYQLMSVGWNGWQRIHGCILHIDIKNGKIWIQHDGTEEGVANRFVEAGIPKEGIVLGLARLRQPCPTRGRAPLSPFAGAKLRTFAPAKGDTGCHRHDTLPASGAAVVAPKSEDRRSKT